jgi:transposase
LPDSRLIGAVVFHRGAQGVMERTMAWLTGYRRLTLRYERNASHFLAFITLAAMLTCYKKFIKLAT